MISCSLHNQNDIMVNARLRANLFYIYINCFAESSYKSVIKAIMQNNNFSLYFIFSENFKNEKISTYDGLTNLIRNGIAEIKTGHEKIQTEARTFESSIAQTSVDFKNNLESLKV